MNKAKGHPRREGLSTTNRQSEAPCPRPAAGCLQAGAGNTAPRNARGAALAHARRGGSGRRHMLCHHLLVTARMSRKHAAPAPRLHNVLPVSAAGSVAAAVAALERAQVLCAAPHCAARARLSTPAAGHCAPDGHAVWFGCVGDERRRDSGACVAAATLVFAPDTRATLAAAVCHQAQGRACAVVNMRRGRAGAGCCARRAHSS